MLPKVISDVKSGIVIIYVFLIEVSCKTGCVAQLVEHRAFNLMAVGSSPAVPKNCCFCFLYADLDKAFIPFWVNTEVINI